MFAQSIRKGECYVRNTADMMRALYEFGYIHYKTMKLPQPRISIKDMKKKVLKTKALQRRLRRTSLLYMANWRKDAKDVYYGLLIYDIAIYTKHCEEISITLRKKWRVGW